MIKYFRKAFVITNENIILATPLVLFLFLLSLYLGVAKNTPENIQYTLLLIATILFMLSAFFAGWFYMVKRAIDIDKQEFIAEEEKAKASFHLMREIPIGIGEFFLAFLGALLLYITFLFLIGLLTFKIGMHYIGDVGLNLDQLRTAFGSTTGMKSVVESLTETQIIRLNAWNFLFLVAASVYSFLTMFWGPQIIYKTKNPLIAFFSAIKVLLKRPFSSVILFVYISLVNGFSSLINAVSINNSILYFISMLIYFYLIVYVVVLIFLYYDREIREKSEYYNPESNITESDSDSGADSFGKDESGDSDSKED